MSKVPPQGTETAAPFTSVAAPAGSERHPTVSVVLPAYNRSATIVAAIDSVLRQTWQDFELIVVDDGSTDGTADVVRTLQNPRVRLIEQKQNCGASAARNRGIQEAKGDWVAFQDSDDEWLPEKLERQMARLLDPQTDWIACYCGMLIIGAVIAKAGRTRVRYHPDPSEHMVEGDIRQSLMRTSLVSTQMLVARRDLLGQIGGFDEALPALVDWELVLRLSEQGKFAFVDEPLVLQRFSANSITQDQSRRITARSRILDKHGISWPTELLARQYQILAGEHRDQGNISEAVRAIGKARALRPLDIGLILRSLALVFAGIRKRNLQIRSKTL